MQSLDLRRHCERRLGALDRERASWFAHWRDLSAVRAGRVYAVDGNAYFNRSGPRMVDSLEILGHLIHPELFAPPATASAFARL